MRVFISSTFVDLQDHRKRVFRALQKLGVPADDMIHWPADERPPAEYSVDRVRHVDLMILLLAHRYGYVAPGESISVTELEYNGARESGVPVLAFLAADDVAWPPAVIDTEHRLELERLKTRVRQEITPDTFRSADDLSAQVTAAVASFMGRHAQTLAAKRRFGSQSIKVQSRQRLKTQANGVVEIGTAEDGLPLLLAIVRTPDPATELDRLARKLRKGEVKPETTLIERLQQTLLRKDWAGERIVEVFNEETLETEELFVTSANLSELFQSSLELLLSSFSADDSRAAASDSLLVHPWNTDREPSTELPIRPAPAPRRDVWEKTTHRFMGIRAKKKLESVGGTNRFLGLSLGGPGLYSVGRADGWRVWREFLPESLPMAFPDAQVDIRIDRSTEDETEYDHVGPVPIASYPKTLFDHAVTALSRDGRVKANVSFQISRQDLAALLARVARSLEHFHARGHAHGDLKPQNTLLTADGTVLIDAFDLPEGEVSPGFTPGWSAPEQILGQPISVSCDLYPLGRMIAQLLGGRLVGEVRKFRTPHPGPLNEIDVLHDPTVWLGPSEAPRALDPDTVKGLESWLALAHSCLRFNPAERPSSADEFAQRLDSLCGDSPLPGETFVDLQSSFVGATLPDGRDVVARLVAT